MAFYSMKHKNLIFFISAIIVAIPCFIVIPLNASDLYAHKFFLEFFTESLTEGNASPNWLGGVYAGCGAPTFFFYPPLTYYISTPFLLLVKDTQFAFGFFMFFTTFIGSYFMYSYLRYFLKKNIAIFATVAYIFFPLKVAIFYLGGTPSEYLGYVFVPIFLFSIHKILDGNYRFWVLLGLSMALMIISSVSLVAILFFFFPIYVIFSYFLLHNKNNRGGILKISFYGSLSLLLSIALSIFYLSPMLIERAHVHISKVANEHEIFFNLAWGVHAGPLIISLLLSIFFAHKIFKSNDYIAQKIGLLGFIFTGLLIFLMSPFSIWLWNNITLLKTIHLPMRLTLILAFIFPLMFGLFIKNYPMAKFPDSKRFIGATFALFLALFAMNQFGTTKSPEEDLRVETSSRYFHEFLPAQVPYENWNNPKNVLESAKQCRKKFLVMNGSATLTNELWQNNRIELSISAETDSTIQLGHFWYHLWEASIDNEKIPLSYSDKNGQMILDIPKGKYNLILNLKKSKYQSESNIISIIAWLFTFFTLATQIFRKKLTIGHLKEREAQ